MIAIAISAQMARRIRASNFEVGESAADTVGAISRVLRIHNALLAGMGSSLYTCRDMNGAPVVNELLFAASFLTDLMALDPRGGVLWATNDA